MERQIRTFAWSETDRHVNPEEGHPRAIRSLCVTIALFRTRLLNRGLLGGDVPGCVLSPRATSASWVACELMVLTCTLVYIWELQSKLNTI